MGLDSRRGLKGSPRLGQEACTSRHCATVDPCNISMSAMSGEISRG